MAARLEDASPKAVSRVEGRAHGGVNKGAEPGITNETDEQNFLPQQVNTHA